MLKKPPQKSKHHQRKKEIKLKKTKNKNRIKPKTYCRPTSFGPCVGCSIIWVIEYDDQWEFGLI
jgi:hypothetical protein